MAVNQPATVPAPGNGPRRYLAEVYRRTRGGELSALPVVAALLVIWLVFQSLDGSFLSPRNLSTLSVDITALGLMAVGAVFVLLVGDIDLSVASVSALSAALFAILNANHGVPEWLALLLAVCAGAAIGVFHGLFVARLGVPAFVVTLAGLLGWNGLMLYILGPTGSINLNDEGLLARLTSTYFPGATAYGLAALSVAGFFLFSWLQRRRRSAAGLPVRAAGEIVARTAVLAVITFAAAAVLAAFQGLPLALVLFLAVVTGLDFVLRRTTYGRKVFSLGGGQEAARRAGVDIVAVRVSVFAISSTMAALGGLFFASRVSSVSQAAGSGELLINVIAAAVIGGTSLYGGRGSTWAAVLGVLVIQSIASGMALLGIEIAVQYMITGAVLLAAIVLDSLNRRSSLSIGHA
jgi:D-xylose transport system permease protein